MTSRIIVCPKRHSTNHRQKLQTIETLSGKDQERTQKRVSSGINIDRIKQLFRNFFGGSSKSYVLKGRGKSSPHKTKTTGTKKSIKNPSKSTV
jgi:hypothetical protein